MGRLPAENGLPQYVSKHARSGYYQYYRRPPTGVVGKAFVRSFGSKDRRVMMAKYAAIHDEAEKYFDGLASGRLLSDIDLKVLAMGLSFGDDLDKRRLDGTLRTRNDLWKLVAEVSGDHIKHLSQPDMTRLLDIMTDIYLFEEVGRVQKARTAVEDHEKALRTVVPVAASPNALTLMRAFNEAWLPSAKRSEGTIVETKRFVEDFIKLNGDHDLQNLTREHWAKWRAQCLEIHGPGWTALKRFSMCKTVVAEAIRAGLFERKNHAGQDVVMKKPKRTQLRNEGWSDAELKTLFGSSAFTNPEGKHADANYWVPVIIALTGARLSEVAGMQVPDVGMRHGVLTFFLARDEGKTEESRRIIPVPEKLIQLGLKQFIATLDPKGALFQTINSDILSKWFGRHRRSIGLTRKGGDLHAFRHHTRTLLRNLGTPDVVADWITGHSSDAVSSTYGKTELQTALGYLNQIDLGVEIPKWQAPG